MAGRKWTHQKHAGPTSTETLRRIIPRDRTFTLPEIIPIAQAAMLRPTPPSTIRKGLRLLEQYGEVRRVKRAAYGVVQWEVCDGPQKELPLEAMRLPDVAAMLLELGGPMSLVELVIAMQRLGYRAEVRPQSMLHTLRWCLKGAPGRFVEGEDGRWQSALTKPANAK
jgi:hypothetical protein